MDEFRILPLSRHIPTDKFTCPGLFICSYNNITSLSSEDLGDAIIKIDFFKCKNVLLALDLLECKALQNRREEVLTSDMLIFCIGERENFKLA